MGRTKTPVHRLSLRKHHGRAVCKWGGREVSFGPWDASTPEALANFQRQVGVWASDPGAGVRRADAELLIDLWADWLASPAAAVSKNGAVKVCGRHLLGTPAEPGQHLTTAVGEFTPPVFAAWQHGPCRVERTAGRTRYNRATVGRFRR